MRALLSSSLLLLGLVLPLGCVAWSADGPAMQDLAQREAIHAEVWSAAEQGDFAEIERLATRYRDPAQRTSSGLWKLTAFYAALADYVINLEPCESEPTPDQGFFGNWSRAMPGSPTLMLVRARQQVCVALEARAAAADDDHRADAALMNATIALHRQLRQHEALAGTDPYFLEVMMLVQNARRQPDERAAALRQLGEHRPSYYQGWMTALDLAAQQEDRAAAIERLVRQALAATQRDEGYTLYARLYWYASQRYYADALFEQSQADWPTMRQGIDDVMARYPDAWNANNFARFACDAGDRAETAELMAKVGDAPLEQAWPDLAMFERCRELAASTDAKPAR